MTKVRSEIIEPKKERPSEGQIKFNIDLSVYRDNQDYSNEIQKILEKIIKESKCVGPQFSRLSSAPASSLPHLPTNEFQS